MIPHRPPHIHPDNSIIFVSARLYGGISWLQPDHVKRYFLDKLRSTTQKYTMKLHAYVVCDNHYHLIVETAQGSFIPKLIQQLHGATAHYIRAHVPDIVSLGDQVLTRSVTPWDRRQNARISKETIVLSRGLTSARTDKDRHTVIAQFTTRHPKILRRLKSATTTRTSELQFAPGDMEKLFSHVSDPQILSLFLSDDPPIWYQYMDHAIRDDRDYYMHLNYIHQNPVKHGLTTHMSTYPWSSFHEWVKKEGKEFVIDCFRTYPITDWSPAAD